MFNKGKKYASVPKEFKEQIMFIDKSTSKEDQQIIKNTKKCNLKECISKINRVKVSQDFCNFCLGSTDNVLNLEDITFIAYVFYFYFLTGEPYDAIVEIQSVCS